MVALPQRRIPGKIDPLAASGGLGVSDTFNRPDSASSMGSTDGPFSGDPATWVAASGTWGITSNRAYCTSGGPFRSAYVETGLSDVEASVTIAAFGGVNQGLAVRVQDSANYLWILAVSGSLIYCRYEGGGHTNVASSSGFNAGDVIKVRAVGSNINVYRNDILVITQTDTTFQSATKHGLVCNNSTGVRFDNFSVLGV